MSNFEKILKQHEEILHGHAEIKKEHAELHDLINFVTAENATLRAQVTRLEAECEKWAIIDGGNCVPIATIKGENYTEVTIEWIESSRRGWSKLAGELKRYIESRGLVPDLHNWRKSLARAAREEAT